MFMRWTDIQHLAAELAGQFPDVDPKVLSFAELRDRVMALPEMLDEVEQLSREALDNIQTAWQEEYLDESLSSEHAESLEPAWPAESEAGYGNDLEDVIPDDMGQDTWPG